MENLRKEKLVCSFCLMHFFIDVVFMVALFIHLFSHKNNGCDDK